MSAPIQHPVFHGLVTGLEEALASGDLDTGAWMFDEDPVFFGTSDHSAGRDAVLAHLARIVEQSGALRWEWTEERVVHETEVSLVLAATGEIVVTHDDTEDRAPFRLTMVAVFTPDGWRVQHWHGSVPSDRFA